MVAHEMPGRAAERVSLSAARSASFGAKVPKAVNAYVGLGSNLGDREALLRFALEALNAAPNLTIEAVSRVYETDPVGPGEQGAYLNAAVSIQTLLSAEQLLECLLAIELKAGRDRAAETERWSARTLDLDLLFFGETIVELQRLQIPHPRLHERPFVLEPLCDLAPDFLHPRTQTTLAELAHAVRDESAVRLWPTSLAVPQ